MEYALGAVVLLIALGLGSYMFLLIFYPEWVGITGKSGKKTMSDHVEGAEVKEEGFFEDLTKTPKK